MLQHRATQHISTSVGSAGIPHMYLRAYAAVVVLTVVSPMHARIHRHIQHSVQHARNLVSRMSLDVEQHHLTDKRQQQREEARRDGGLRQLGIMAIHIQVDLGHASMCSPCLLNVMVNPSRTRAVTLIASGVICRGNASLSDSFF